MIFGGGMLGRKLAQVLVSRDVKVKLIETCCWKYTPSALGLLDQLVPRELLVV